MFELAEVNEVLSSRSCAALAGYDLVNPSQYCAMLGPHTYFNMVPVLRKTGRAPCVEVSESQPPSIALYLDRVSSVLQNMRGI